ncbi:mannitol-1-phosphate dehydrogenase M1PDH1 [Coprinopsis sp. MPI-PUGE-AT-0042]|nr:mannitol-1-phosphate dehydrogenase M1PDH1 [Coprinopsis sp. MPI-PUGE-AT-0042]
MSTKATSIPLTQRAAVPSPEIGKEYTMIPNQCLISLSIQEFSPAKTPLVGGHEGIGRIVAIGENSATTGPKVGDRVGIKWIGRVSCTTSFQIIHGKGIHGSFQEFAVSYLDYVTPIPEGGDVASLTPILCAVRFDWYKALKQANAHIGDWIAISGAGGGPRPFGRAICICNGFESPRIDTERRRKDIVMRLGAEKWIDFKESKDIIKDIQAATGAQLPIPMIIGKSLNIIGSAIGNRQDVAEALEIAARGKVKCEYEVRELADINQIFDELQAGTVAGRIVVRLNPEQA